MLDRMDTPGIPAPAPLRNLLNELFDRIESSTGWKLGAAGSATVEIVRDGSGYTLYVKGRYPGRDLDEIEGHPA
jgi:hypothetical protein